MEEIVNLSNTITSAILGGIAGFVLSFLGYRLALRRRDFQVVNTLSKRFSDLMETLSKSNDAEVKRFVLVK